jgi:hypothetical protein
MKSKAKFSMIALGLAAVGAISRLFVFSYVVDTLTRVKRELGIQIPPAVGPGDFLLTLREV